MRPSWSIIRVIIAFTTCAADALVAATHTCPRPMCSWCMAPEEVHAVGIGFDLSASYGTAVIRYHNGSSVNVAKIDASMEYRSLMEQLSENGRQRALPGRSDSGWDEPGHLGDSSQRRLQAALPDLDISALSSLISQLKAETERLLGHSIHSVAISSPGYIQLSEAEIAQAIEHLGLKNIASDYDLAVTSSEYAGYSFGIFTIPTTVDPCEQTPRQQTEPETVLHLDYTEAALSGSTSSSTPQDTIPRRRTDGVFADWNLGLSKRPRFIEEEAYWDLLWRRIRTETEKSERKLTGVIMTGDAIFSGSRFLEVALDALRGLVEPSAVLQAPEHTPDLVFAAARGAAEFAKRTQERPRDCVESERCRSLRG
ncbi:predicted protein [Histoplasma capsulatum G186AR]|uniref:Uncharacterized protein n=2 Tax=Ajellomyces capsulatus TaxID=5037 RepID=C0NM67_AJECG|nr:uncharacterized protein HCBG_04597 [Histoplasma capsulatum G186AR]EEH07718.1 predicted protein [Histoplasma capsulatum G186AR]KAG5304142.1 hypothetical protein I7I52_02378 [Histoplasma capsulatum]QSS69740.1 hypothetical protein I7I50_11139 [Histoplasma capsulatum G186AR]